MTLNDILESRPWKTIGHLSVLSWICTLILPAILGLVSAWKSFAHGKPFEVVLLWSLVTAASTLATILLALVLVTVVRDWFARKSKNDKPLVTTAIPRAEPNLNYETLKLGAMYWDNGAWRIGVSQSGLAYLSYALPITNAPKVEAGKTVADAENIKAQVIFSIGGTEILKHSPARWVNESQSTITIPVCETRDLILLQRDMSGVWQLNYEPLKMRNRGELKIRILRASDAGTEKEKTWFFRWYRTTDPNVGLLIEPVEKS